MPLFSKGIPRLAVVAITLAAFCLVPPEVLGRGPDICLWKHLLHLPACPACGSTRALAAFFHGHLQQAVSYNYNVLITGPLLLAFFVKDLLLAARRSAS